MARRRQIVPTIEEAEDAIVTALEADSTLSDLVSTFGSCQGTWTEARDELARRLPAVTVMFAGGKHEARGMGDGVLQGEWHLLVGARNLRREAARRTSDAGAYAIAEAVIATLDDQHLDLDGLGPLRFRELGIVEQSGPRDRAVSIYLLVFEGDLDVRHIEGTDDLATIAADYQVANVDEDTGDTGWAGVVTSLDADIIDPSEES